MKFRLVEDVVTESDLTDKNLIKELQDKFGSDFDSKPLCKEVTEYISTKFGVKGLYYTVLVLSKEDGLISENSHCVIYHNNRLYDYTSNQYCNYSGIETSECPRILYFNKEISDKLGMKSYSSGNYIVCVSEHV